MCALGGIRTHTIWCLRPSSLPLEYQGPEYLVRMMEMPRITPARGQHTGSGSAGAARFRLHYPGTQSVIAGLDYEGQTT
jgi:hypothetical protein